MQKMHPIRVYKFHVLKSFSPSHGLRLLSVLIMTVILALALSGCTKNEPQESVADAAVTQTPENVARVFAQAIFQGDYELMFSCYPASYTDSLTEEDFAPFIAWEKETQTSLQTNATEYVGTRASNASVYNEDTKSSEYLEAVAGISVKYDIASEDISDIRGVVVRLFKTIDGTDKYQDVQVLVYKSGVDWYVSDMEYSNSSDS